MERPPPKKPNYFQNNKTINKKLTTMKTTILKLSAFVLFFALMGAGCEKEKKYEDIPLEYIKCPCNNDTSFTRKITIQDVLLFDASKTSENEMRSLRVDGEKSQFIRYHKDTKSALLCI